MKHYFHLVDFRLRSNTCSVVALRFVCVCIVCVCVCVSYHLFFFRPMRINGSR